jgi:hypothetical protein
MSSTAESTEKQPEIFADAMRHRAEQALSASVHHASLSQQYLTLAQKFSGLAEQALYGTGGLQAVAAQLDREALTGCPAPPTPFPQAAFVRGERQPATCPAPSASGLPPLSGAVPDTSRYRPWNVPDESTGVRAAKSLLDTGPSRLSAVEHSATSTDQPTNEPIDKSTGLTAAAVPWHGQLRQAVAKPLGPNGSDQPAGRITQSVAEHTPEQDVHDSAVIAGSAPAEATAELPSDKKQALPDKPTPEAESPATADALAQTGTADETPQPTDPQAETPESSTGESDNPESASSPADTPLRAAAVRQNRRRRSNKSFSVRRLLERARMVALEQADRVRIRARRSDLKPKLRSTTEELTEELKRSRMPATISTVVTAIALLLLAISRLEIPVDQELPPLSASFSGPDEPVDESFVLEPPMETAGEQQLEPTETLPPEAEPLPEPELPLEPEMLPEPEVEIPPELVPPPIVEPADAEPALPESPVGRIAAKPDAKASTSGAKFDHRDAAGRQQMLQKYGGSVGSENAVSLALQWLARRQRADGSWDFVDVGPCTSPGRIMNPIGGTAYALMPFLAAGHTHKAGPYRKQIEAGLRFLTQIGVSVPAGYDLRGVLNKRDDDVEPNYAYYVQGAATLVLCEAYGMTRDRALKAPAEAAVLFLLNSQDPRGGGWRYTPGQPGSTSCTAIQVMALKAAEKAGIRIPETTWAGVSNYLDGVAIDREGRYGYETTKKAYEASVTSMALLSRMYLGWGRDDGDLRAGVALLDKRGPYDNLYYCYFATQVMRNWGGQEWERWNGRLRDDLVAWQEQTGDAQGSWAPRDRSDYSISGGRLLITSLATLTLEVYYRYQPLLPEQTEAAVP